MATKTVFGPANYLQRRRWQKRKKITPKWQLLFKQKTNKQTENLGLPAAALLLDSRK